ncbi:hypothetical protein ACU4GD_43405 [Cupriavidus basilensis]
MVPVKPGWVQFPAEKKKKDLPSGQVALACLQHPGADEQNSG